MFVITLILSVIQYYKGNVRVGLHLVWNSHEIINRSVSWLYTLISVKFSSKKGIESLGQKLKSNTLIFPIPNCVKLCNFKLFDYLI